jgi:hypothetical protein
MRHINLFEKFEEFDYRDFDEAYHIVKADDIPSIEKSGIKLGSARTQDLPSSVHGYRGKLFLTFDKESCADMLNALTEWWFETVGPSANPKVLVIDWRRFRKDHPKVVPTPDKDFQYDSYEEGRNGGFFIKEEIPYKYVKEVLGERDFKRHHVKESVNESIDVFHGSGIKFDRFDINKVGSAQGGDVGGWGIYFSDHIQVANRYTTGRGFVGEYALRDDSEWFDLDEPLDDATSDRIAKGLEGVAHGDDVEQFKSDFVPYECTNMQVYDWLSVVLGDGKGASLFLKKLGYDGNRFHDRTDTDATNYVVFDTSQIIYK